MAEKEEEYILKMAEAFNKEDKDFEAYKSLTALYIQVDESVMTRHKFFLTIVVAIFTAIGYLFYQLDNCNYVQTLWLIIAAIMLGIGISIAWLFISNRGLYIDKIISRELIDIEEKLKIYPAFSYYIHGLIRNKYSDLKDTEIKNIQPECLEKYRMENIQIFLTGTVLLIFIILILIPIYMAVSPVNLKQSLGLNVECKSNSKASLQECCALTVKENPVHDEKGNITNSPVNNISINIPTDKDKPTNAKENDSNTSPLECSLPTEKENPVNDGKRKIINSPINDIKINAFLDKDNNIKAKPSESSRIPPKPKNCK